MYSVINAGFLQLYFSGIFLTQTGDKVFGQNTLSHIKEKMQMLLGAFEQDNSILIPTGAAGLWLQHEVKEYKKITC